MKVLVLGSGSREHALVWRFMQSPRTTAVYCAPGNGGTAGIAANLDLRVDDPAAVLACCRQRGIDLVVPGPEAAVAAGVADALAAGTTTTLCWGPTAAAGRLESSKAFAKELMTSAGIPTPSFHTFTDLAAAERMVEESQRPWVVKADGLAQGKGVVVAASVEETISALRRMLKLKVLGEAGARVVLEEVVSGPELTVMAACDGSNITLLAAACDYKRAGDGDSGPNTGGMGAYSPPAFATAAVLEEVRARIIEPAVRAMAQRGHPYCGVLYAGVMLTSAGPLCLEFNARFGDPEAQVVLPRLATDVVELALACCQGRLDGIKLEWSEEVAVGVVLTSAGYPERYQTGFPIRGLHLLPPGVMAFHGGTGLRPVGISRRPALVTTGGRVLTLVARGRDHAEARELAYAAADRVDFEGKAYRTDIARREMAS